MSVLPTAIIHNLEVMERLRHAPLPQAIDALHLKPGAAILDIGCGLGQQTLQLAEAVPPPADVIGLDISQDLLDYAHTTVARSQNDDRIRFAAGDMRLLPSADDTFDLCWSADCLGYPAADHLPLLREAVRVARRDAAIAVLGWSSQTLLPGHTMLEARLNATSSAYEAYLSQSDPEQHFMRLGAGLAAAGLRDIRCQTFIGEAAAPLDNDQRLALLALFEMLWGSALGRASDVDQQAYARLCRPESPDCVLKLQDYIAFFTYTAFTGTVWK
jgi:ubiquinone/menaquinone biosynthesis C-methylase UbiE